MYKASGQNFSMPLTPYVKWLLIINVGVWFFLQVLVEQTFKLVSITNILALQPGQVLFQFSLWQIFTYMFLHSTSAMTHILFNMLMLWFFGSELEERWGGRKFLGYYMGCGIGAAVIYVFCIGIYSALTGGQLPLRIPVIGASGAIFGLLVAQGILFGERVVHFFMIFPMKTKYFVTLMGFLQIASLLTTGFAGGEVAYLAHLGGLLSGYLYLLTWTYLSRYQTRRKQQRKNSNLRLVVDNEDKKKNEPKYWN